MRTIRGSSQHYIEPDKDYKVDVTAYNFFGTEVEFNTLGMKPGAVDYLVQLNSLDAGSRIELKNIYYDLAKVEYSARCSRRNWIDWSQC